MTFQTSVAKVIGREGRYSNDPKDSGGETMWGITKRLAVAHGYTGPMSDMDQDEARRIYHGAFWMPLRLDEIDRLAPAVADELFDSAVNCGGERAAKWLQRSLNALNQEGTLFADVAVDGRIGPVTVSALREYLSRRGAFGATVLLRALNSLQGTYYIELAEARQKDERFVYGWLSHRVA